MIHLSRVGRPPVAVIVIVILVVAAGATAGIRWKQWVPVNACLFCDTPASDVASSPASGGVAVGTAGAFRSPGGGAAARTSASSPDGAPVPRSAADSGLSKLTGSRSPWQPWSTSWGSNRNYSSSGQSPSSSLGGLWRLMNLSYQRPGVVDTVATSAPAAAPPAQNPKPSAPGAAAPPKGPRPPAPPKTAAPAPAPQSDPAPSPAAAPDVTAPAPTDPFHDHESPLPDPFVPPPPAGPLDPGGPGSAPAPGGDLSANPEPGSILLIGTGLVGIFGVLRRRRLI